MSNEQRAARFTAVIFGVLCAHGAACGGGPDSMPAPVFGAGAGGGVVAVPAGGAHAGGVIPVAGASTAGSMAVAGIAGTGATPPPRAGTFAPATGSGGMSAAIGGSGPGAGTAGAVAAGSGGSGPMAGAAATEMPGDIEKCYELRAHGQPVAGDASKYSAPTGETYTSFVFKAPWTTNVQGLRFRHLPDNAAVLHHWLLYRENNPGVQDGQIDPCMLEGPTGFICGSASGRELITGWAPGRNDFTLPSDVGLELPPPGGLMAVELHYFNSGAAAAADRSGVEICVTSKFRKNTASVSWLGTETINVAAGVTGTASGKCTPARRGMNASDPIHVLYSWPHMHKLGTHLKSVVNRAAGGMDVMYDGEFSFDRQQLHDSPVLLMPGDTVTTTCTFKNSTTMPVGFGPSTTAEMCFNFTYAWPAHALDNPGGGIGTAGNACLN